MYRGSRNIVFDSILYDYYSQQSEETWLRNCRKSHNGPVDIPYDITCVRAIGSDCNLFRHQ